MRYAVATLLALHGALHLLGFLKAFDLAKLTQLSGRTLVPLPARAVGIAWLLAFVMFAAAATLVLLRVDAWWPLTGAALVLSQALIVLQWHDAKAGTVANVLLLVAVVIGGAMARFDARVDRETRALLSAVPTRASPAVEARELDALPEPVRRWLRASGVVGRPPVRSVRLEQTGLMRMKPGGEWMPVEAEQVFDLQAPAFLWSVRTAMWRVVPVRGRDLYSGGHGHMLITLGGLITVADGKGPGIDQGTMLRYLAEMVWFPSAALGQNVAWQAVDENTARATLTAFGQTAEADFTFDAGGRFQLLTAQRDCSLTGRRERWQIPARAWKRFDGIEVPSQGDAVWKLPTGDLDYFRWRITRLDYDETQMLRATPEGAQDLRAAHVP